MLSGLPESAPPAIPKVRYFSEESRRRGSFRPAHERCHRLKLNSATAIDDHVRVQSEMAGVERTVLDAIIQGESHQVDVLDPALLQVMSKTGVATMRVVEKRAVTVDVSLGPFVKNVSDAGGVE